MKTSRGRSGSSWRALSERSPTAPWLLLKFNEKLILQFDPSACGEHLGSALRALPNCSLSGNYSLNSRCAILGERSPSALWPLSYRSPGRYKKRSRKGQESALRAFSDRSPGKLGECSPCALESTLDWQNAHGVSIADFILGANDKLILSLDLNRNNLITN